MPRTHSHARQTPKQLLRHGLERMGLEKRVDSIRRLIASGIPEKQSNEKIVFRPVTVKDLNDRGFTAKEMAAASARRLAGISRKKKR